MAGFHNYAIVERWQKRLGVVAIIWKPLLAIVMITTIISKPAYMETAKRSKSQPPLNFFGSNHSDHMETSLKMLFCIDEFLNLTK